MTNAEKMLAFAREQIGKLYDLGDHGLPSDKWDCSGLTMEMAKLCGKKWPHSSHTQYYNNPDLPEYGETATMPRDKDCFLFRYGERTSGKGMGMIHVGYYAADKGTEIQAGGNGPIVNLEVYEQNLAKGMTLIEAVKNSLAKDHPGGTRKSVVWEQEFHPKYFTHWRRGAWMDEGYIETAPVVPQDGTGTTMPTLRKGSTGEEVKTVQNILNQYGAGLEVDGKFGMLTKKAVEKYQQDNSLKVDGVVGPKTWTELLEDDADPDEQPEEAEPLYAVTIPDCTLVRANAIQGVYKNATMTLQK